MASLAPAESTLRSALGRCVMAVNRPKAIRPSSRNPARTRVHASIRLDAFIDPPIRNWNLQQKIFSPQSWVP